MADLFACNVVLGEGKDGTRACFGERKSGFSSAASHVRPVTLFWREGKDGTKRNLVLPDIDRRVKLFCRRKSGLSSAASHVRPAHL